VQRQRVCPAQAPARESYSFRLPIAFRRGSSTPGVWKTSMPPVMGNISPGVKGRSMATGSSRSLGWKNTLHINCRNRPGAGVRAEKDLHSRPEGYPAGACRS